MLSTAFDTLRNSWSSLLIAGGSAVVVSVVYRKLSERFVDPAVNTIYGIFSPYDRLKLIVLAGADRISGGNLAFS